MTLATYSCRRSASVWLSEAADALASVCFPAPCGICEKPLLRANRVPICEECLASFTPLPKKGCEICGQPIESFYTEVEVGLRCANCAPPRYAFARVRSMAIYGDALVNAVLMLKYRRVEAQENGSANASRSWFEAQGMRTVRTLWYRYRYTGSAQGPRFQSPRCSPNLP
jgi:hypothetical protein